MKRYRIRFHLAKGENYMKWQVFDLQTNTKRYLDPDSKSIIMMGCELGNQPATSKKIFNGEAKTVCAWVRCNDLKIKDRDGVIPPPINGMTHYKFNPKKNPHWHTDRIMNADGKKFPVMMTYERKVYG